jgi:flagellar biosynthetic protein FlhB
VSEESIWKVLELVAVPAGMAVLPIAGTCMVAGVLANVVQVGLKPAPKAIKPNFKKLNPIAGAKNIFGTRALFEAVKNVSKVAVVGSIAGFAVFPKLEDLAALVGMPPVALAPAAAREILSVGQRAAAAYLVIAIADVIYQRWRHDKDLRMAKQEVKDEVKQQGLPAEVRQALRRRQMQVANARMMDAVPTADVVVTNPTHYSVALRYDAEKAAPEVVAKGMDHLALRIREAAREHGVQVVPDPPLARSLHATVEVGQLIPEELYAAVAQVLAFVYRTAGRTA